MKKIWYLWGMLILALIAGCGSGKQASSSNEIEHLNELGFSESSAQEFYSFGNESKSIFEDMTRINNYLAEEDFVVSNDDFKKITKTLENLKQNYSEMNPKNTEDYYKYIDGDGDEHVMSSPIQILKNIEKNHRNFTLSESAMMFDMMTFYAKQSIKSSGLNEKNSVKALAWYHDNNNYTEYFKESYEHRTDNGENIWKD